MVNATVLGDDVGGAECRHGLRLAEEIVDLIHVMHVQVEQSTAGLRTVHEPVFPRIAVNRGGNALERGGPHLSGLAALEVFVRMAIFRPCTDAKPNIEELLRLADGGNNLFEFGRGAAKRLFAEDMLTDGKRGAHEIAMLRGWHADVHDINVRICDHVERIVIHRNARKIERLGVVSAADVPDDRRDVAFALLGIHVRKRNDFGVLHPLIDTPMSTAHETESHKTNLYLFHHVSLSFNPTEIYRAAPTAKPTSRETSPNNVEYSRIDQIRQEATRQNRHQPPRSISRFCALALRESRLS